jgi:DNA invertase Pin-like site-specific DNA recombinase
MGGQIVCIFEVPGHTRKYIKFSDAARDMPAYRQLEEACEQGKFDVLWCRARDRLGRTDALISTTEEIVRTVGRAEVYSAFMPHDVGHASEASAIVSSAVERAIAQTESIQRVARTAGAIRARVKRGKHSCNWPHGYRAVKDITGKTVGGEMVSGEIEAVQFATSLFLDGRSYTKIVQALNDSSWRPRRAKQWSWSVVRGMMNNDFYAGIIVYGRKSDEPVYSSPSEASYPILWDNDTYQAILQERQRRKQDQGGSGPKSSLSGTVICGKCGWVMTVRTYRTGNRAFQCGKHKWAYVIAPTRLAGA